MYPPERIGMTEYQILYWREVPAQVRVFAGRRPLSRPLPDRFQEEIDRRAMRDGLVGTDEYLAQWQWTERRRREGEPEAVLAAVVDELVAEHDRNAPS